jgi:hypothetical protein
MKKTNVSFTLTAKQANLSKNLTIVLLWSETTVIILYITTCNNYIMCDLDKVTIIAAMWTNNPTEWFFFLYLNFLHIILHKRLLKRPVFNNG